MAIEIAETPSAEWAVLSPNFGNGATPYLMPEASMPDFDHMALWNMAILPPLNSVLPEVSSPRLSVIASCFLAMSPNMSRT
ncbi:hypothetical protein D3C87_1804030 [compost metagenome]